MADPSGVVRAILSATLMMMLMACTGGDGRELVEGQVEDGELQKPVLIAHRGLSGEYPEHIIAGYQAAIDAGADFIEPDLVLTRDGVLVARHENDISETTDIADHPEFSDRRTSKIIDGKKVTGWFTEDFTLAEIKTLRAKERLPMLRKGNRVHDGKYEIPTFEEILQLLARVNAARDRPVGVYPETKHPGYFTSIGLPHEGEMLRLLTAYGYHGRDAAVFIQSFEVGNLRALRAKTDLPLIQLMEASGTPADRPDLTYADMATAAGLREVATYADGIGPDKNMVIPRNFVGNLGEASPLVADAHSAGLKVHPWTFRRENYFLPLSMKSGINPAAHGDLAAEVKAFVAAGVDGLFTDNMTEVAQIFR